MKNRIIYTLLFALMLTGASCSDWLEREPSNMLTEQQVWSDTKMADGVLANMYGRIPQVSSMQSWVEHSLFDDAMWSGSKNYDQQARNNFVGYPYDWFRLWDYTLIREINQAIAKCDEAGFTQEDKDFYKSEFRFIRAQVYFEMVRRMGGVPLITEVFTYDENTTEQDVANMRRPRSKEYEIYDFIGTEVDEIAENLIPNNARRGRANKYTALALKSRAMLYAASLAKYNNTMTSPITMDGEYLGIPASKAAGYYTASLAASKAIIDDAVFVLQMGDQTSENFFKAVCEKNANKEVIWARDYSSTMYHAFTFDNTTRSAREDNLGGASVAPTLNLVEAYDYLDGTEGKLKDKDVNGNYIVYANREDIYKNKDTRMRGTVYCPGSSFKGIPLDIQGGVAEYVSPNEYKLVHGAALGAKYTDGKTLIGLDGPLTEEENVSNTGFYVNKFLDRTTGSSMRGQGSTMWWVYYRVGEIYLNAAEAAFELGQTAPALVYVNTIRERAGFPANSLTTLTMAKIQNERRCELAFEDHRLWDVKRWRIAEKLWDGTPASTTANLYALWPYRIVGGPDDGKYIFDRKVAPRFERARWFRSGNYYTSIAQDVLNNNPLLVQNPNY